jgi:hypothetical protein
MRVALFIAVAVMLSAMATDAFSIYGSAGYAADVDATGALKVTGAITGAVTVTGTVTKLTSSWDSLAITRNTITVDTTNKETVALYITCNTVTTLNDVQLDFDQSPDNGTNWYGVTGVTLHTFDLPGLWGGSHGTTFQTFHIHGNKVRLVHTSGTATGGTCSVHLTAY